MLIQTLSFHDCSGIPRPIPLLITGGIYSQHEAPHAKEDPHVDGGYIPGIVKKLNLFFCLTGPMT